MSAQEEHPVERIERAARQIGTIVDLVEHFIDVHERAGHAVWSRESMMGLLATIQGSLGLVDDLREGIGAAVIELDDDSKWTITPVETAASKLADGQSRHAPVLVAANP